MTTTPDQPDAPTPRKRTGRRPGGADTRRTVLEAARAEFAVRGYEKASMRAIGRAAGVDAALLHHYFGSKDRLFMAALEFPVQPKAAVAQLLEGDRAVLGERVAQFVLTLWEQPGVLDRLMALVRAAATTEQVARLMREFVQEELVARIAAELQVEQPELRAELMFSQIVGLAMARYVIGVEPLASATRAELVPLLAPTFQGYLGGA
ncbi:TetR family transcriptional regulator [Kitasatospora sp. NBC_00240]|uniref:TetR/AcrR family transcriptional regulator n=1 Tax=Kitasatospora sp. NBC_00240 TaxID=2903567 RepID=UPI00224D380B|nr:TetR family transcriptional regulator [Kitasatospora sp. NBC_00240]MCX5212529.1 TetR family transcriptional regulator [Kitasatospora sp. NBC_00240]